MRDKEDKEIKNMSVKNMISLCYILDDYDLFSARLNEFLLSKDNRNDVYYLWKISNGKTVLGAKKAKKFYKQNKSIIDEINTHDSISDFINGNYNIAVNLYDDSCLNLFYEYLVKHKEEKDKILSLLSYILMKT